MTNGQAAGRVGGAAIAAFVAVAALFVFTHPFPGFSGDSQIYLGRALADIDPQGVGRDLMFRLDGQSRFTIFPRLAAWLASQNSLLATALWLVAASSCLWFAAVALLARSALTGPIWIGLAIVIAAPAGYGGFDLLRYGEALAEPRPFAEAFVIFALAAFLAGRLALSAACIAVAILFHPIMALAGVATIGLRLCFDDRRWIFVPLVGFVAVAFAYWTAAPNAERLALLDPAWLAELNNRNAYLFPHRWPLAAYALPFTQAVAILVASRRAAPELRRLLLAGLLAGLLGLAIAFVAGEFYPLVILVQAQTWRMWWLTGLLAAVALACAASTMARAEPADRVALAALALSMALAPEFELAAVLLALAALALGLRPAQSRIEISEHFARLTWIAGGVALVALNMSEMTDLAQLNGFAQPDFTPNYMTLVLKFAGPLLAFATVAFAAFGMPRALARMPRGLYAAVAGSAAVGAAFLWNSASSYDNALGHSERQADLLRLAPNGEGEVLWLSASLEPMIWMGRPNWNAEMQGAGGVFSRQIAMAYVDRAQALVDLGLRDQSLVRRAPGAVKSVFPELKREQFVKLCARQDAPSYVVAPIRKDAALDPDLKARRWTAPAVRVDPLLSPDRVEFARIEEYAVIACADHR